MPETILNHSASDALRRAGADEPSTEDPSLFRPTPEEIAAEAYAIYVAHGSDGRDVDDWLEAERRIKGKRPLVQEP